MPAYRPVQLARFVPNSATAQPVPAATEPQPLGAESWACG
jgi:hypothetical protein